MIADFTDKIRADPPHPLQSASPFLDALEMSQKRGFYLKKLRFQED